MTTTAIDRIYKTFEDAFARVAQRDTTEIRIGAELKFPLVQRKDGRAVAPEIVDALWHYLADRGWTLDYDGAMKKPTGGRKPGEQNDSVASCETGYCKPEFSLAHVGDLHVLTKQIKELREELRPFSEEHDAVFLAYGIQPVSPPTADLMMKKTRSGVWDDIFGANRVISPEDGDDVCLFTVNAASHVHVGLGQKDILRAVNVLNGFSAAQLSLTGDSPIWRGEIDPKFKCVSEMFWDWWIPEGSRVGIPERRFDTLRDYVETVAGFKPVYVKRDGEAVLVRSYDTFEQYFDGNPATGVDLEGKEIEIIPDTTDIDLHNSCYWFNSRVSRYFTVENRTNDQQPPDDVQCIAALTLGLVSALDDAEEEIQSYDWHELRSLRKPACMHGLDDAQTSGLEPYDLAVRMVDIAHRGLRRRGKGEEDYLLPFFDRLKQRKNPADQALEIFRERGIEGLLEERRF